MIIFFFLPLIQLYASANPNAQPTNPFSENCSCLPATWSQLSCPYKQPWLLRVVDQRVKPETFPEEFRVETDSPDSLAVIFCHTDRKEETTDL